MLNVGQLKFIKGILFNVFNLTKHKLNLHLWSILEDYRWAY
jgi:hypothetical protein